LYDFSKQIIQTYEALHSRLQEIKDIVSGTIRVATIYSMGLHDLPPYIKKFLKAYPTVHVHVEYRRANQVYEDVLGNVVDLGMVAFPARDSKLEVVPMKKDAMVLICHPQHPLAKQKTVRVSRSPREDHRVRADIPTRKAIDKVLKEHGHDRASGDGIRQHRDGEAGGGDRRRLAIVPQTTVVQEVSKQTLAQVPIRRRGVSTVRWRSSTRRTRCCRRR
jgi:LysR family transcriptional regulator, transcriptional activator of the cysJI operon